MSKALAQSPSISLVGRDTVRMLNASHKRMKSRSSQLWDSHVAHVDLHSPAEQSKDEGWDHDPREVHSKPQDFSMALA